MLWFLIYFIISICVAFYLLNELTDVYCIDGKVIPYFPINKLKYKWISKNIFGKLQIIIFIIIFLPTVISMTLIVLFMIYFMRIWRWFVELGNKK